MLQKDTCKKYLNLSEEEKKKCQYHLERYKNICEDEKQRISEIQAKNLNDSRTIKKIHQISLLGIARIIYFSLLCHIR